MLASATTKENPEHESNENVSEQTGLMDDNLERKNHPDEPKMTAPSTVNETRDNRTKNNGLNSHQVGSKELSSERMVPGERTTWVSPLTSSRRSTYIYTFGSGIIIGIAFTILVLALMPQKLPACPSCPSCPKDWITWRGKCYYFSDDEKTWNSSQNSCSHHGASLFVPGLEKELVRE
ncbi:early activation antigen CD69-like [Heteronotia binoei]|uniref:early activation antigen CD69-like n=1 Tax=Heteronotia binoei TaxID=13085 RepID=UPI0029318C6A|nr:early activation antigen CD69-like [Heteronotia binoei]